MSSSLLFSMLVKMDAGQAKAEMRAFTTEIEKAGNEGVAMAGKLARPTQQATALGRSHQAAAGSVGNLVAQFNDIGMMIAAGQNPLQLAIQQGSQISQVIGPMGASGAVKALGAAFLGMLNPVNLVTFAVIAGGAALVQWAMSGEEATASVEDAVTGMNKAFKAYQDYTKTAAASTADLAKEFGEYAGQVKGFAEFMAQVQVGAVVQSSADVLAGLQQSIAGVLELQSQADQVKASIAQTATMVAQGFGSPSDLLMAQEALALIESGAESAAAAIGLTASQVEVFSQKLNAVETARIAGDTDAMAKAAFEASGYVQALGLNVMDLPAPLQSALTALDSMQNVSAAVADGIDASANAAGRLAANVRAANSYLVKNAVGGTATLARQYEQYGAGRVQGEALAKEQSPLYGPSIDFTPNTRRNSGASAGGAATKEADSVAKLIEKLQAEVDVSRELDPIQREMAQYRTQMAGATDVERQKVEALITQRMREKEVTESLEFVSKQSGDALIDALMGGADAGERLIDSLKRAALQALILGQGPLSGLFGGGLSAAFSLFGGASTGAFGLPFANGGMIYGSGGPRADQVPVMASAGEFIVNARATAQHRPLLERINNGAVPAFANGGIVGGGAAAVREGGSVNINIDARYAQKGVAEEIMTAMAAMVPQIKSIAISAVSDQMRRGRA